MNAFDVAIVGGGAAGALTAIHCLARDPRARIAIVEPRAALARGVAYSTPRDEHLLNVPAARMGCDEARPGDFADWLRGAGGAMGVDIGTAYVPRRRFGDYLAARLREASLGRQVTHLRERAVGCGNGGRVLVLASGARLDAGACVLATGNAPRGLPVPVPAALSERVAGAWDVGAIAGIPPDAAVAIVGTGLSMVDVVLALQAQGHRGQVVASSRHALLPLPHTVVQGAVGIDAAAFAALPLRDRMRRLRELAADAAGAGLPWQWVMQGLRPHGVLLWQTLPPADRARFLRHVARHWDVHRHRVAPQVALAVERMRGTGQLQVVPARLVALEDAGGRIRLRGWRGAGRDMQSWIADWVVDATGIETRFPVRTDPLQQSLHASGLARPGPFGLGLDVDADGAMRDAGGRAGGRIFAIGSLRIGAEWESVAVPELRQQAARIAARLHPRAGPSTS